MKPKPYDRFVLAVAGFAKMSLLLDYLWIWIVLTFIVGACGCAWHLHDQKSRSLILAIVSPILTLAIGFALYYGVDTDRKSITRMLDALIAAVEAGDPNVVCRFISPRVEEVHTLARTQMDFIEVSRAKYHHLEIAVNDAASPPIASVSFSAVFYWKTKSSIEGFSVEQPIPDRARFEIELVKTKDQSWLLTKCRYFPQRGYP